MLNYRQKFGEKYIKYGSSVAVDALKRAIR